MRWTKQALMVLLTCVAAGPVFDVVAGPEVAEAAPAPRYRAGMRVRAKRTCTVQGFEVKKGVVLNVVSVQNDDKGRVSSLDLSFSGMTISAVPAQVVDSLFAPA